ncbi:MAG TPA: macro domain-containing protein [Gemmataceae bacterium]|nr:macro domain-containing protein [Gemmataceae bacterium]
MSNGVSITRTVGQGRIELVLGNIVEQQVDAIVNAANTKLKGGGGVDGAIHRAAGPALKEACFQLPADENGRRCPTGQARTTPAGNLPARHVIHAVGPYYNERYAEKVEGQLRELYENCLAEAVAHGCRSIAFPAISTGAYRFPLDRAAAIALGTVAEVMKREPLELVRFVLYKQSHLDAFRAELERLTRG